METTLPNLDYAAFAADLDELRSKVEREGGAAAHAHLRRQARWGRICSALGFATAWIAPNPVSAALLSLGMTARWTIVAHHTSHRALDRTPGVPVNETSKGFARGWRRWLDWPDWLDPEAWDYEHNKLHHYHTGEMADPDLVEEQLARVRRSAAPMLIKYLVIAFYAFTWKFTYYAPNIVGLARREQQRRAEKRPFDPNQDQTDISLWRMWSPFNADGRAFLTTSALPYMFLRLVLLPALFLPLGQAAALAVLANLVLAELLTGLHTFLVVVPNHAGGDLYRFDRAPTDRAEFYARQVMGSVNFRTGGAVNDFLHGFLNYQIEHHLWPDLAPSLCAMAAPEVRAICARHGVPYVQESVFLRFWKMVCIVTGRDSMRRGYTVAKGDRTASAAG